MIISIINAEIKNPQYQELIEFLDRWNFNYEELPDEELSEPEVNHGTQQSMTKAEMIYPKIGIEPKQFTDTHQERCYPLTVVSDLMDEWAAQEVAKEREKAKKLIGALNEYIVLLGEELDEVMGFVNAHQWKSTRFEQGKILREKIKQSLTEYEKL